MDENLYETLGVPKDATAADVRRAYRRAARSAHPDRGGSTEKFQQIVLARDILSNEARRAKYDRTGQAEEESADQFEANAMNLVAEAVNHVWMECERRAIAVEGVDVVKDATRYIKEKLNAAQNKQREIGASAKNLRKFAARFKAKKDGPNRVRLMLEGRAAELERNAEAIESTLSTVKRALDILSGHVYEWTVDGASTHREVDPLLCSALWRIR